MPITYKPASLTVAGRVAAIKEITAKADKSRVVLKAVTIVTEGQTLEVAGTPDQWNGVAVNDLVELAASVKFGDYNRPSGFQVTSLRHERPKGGA